MNWPLLFMEQTNFGDICRMGGLSIAERKKVFECVKIDDEPVLDGKPDEVFWGEADTQTPFLFMPGGSDPLVQTKTYLAYNNKALFIAYNCKEPKINLVKEGVSARDGEVWQDNSVELFFDPGKTGKDYSQFILSSKGTLFDGASQNGTYNEDFNLEAGKQIEYAIHKDKDSWTFEIKIDFSALNMPAPASGSSIRFNLCRDRILSDGVGNEISSLAALFSSFQTPSRFATMIFK